MIRLKKMYRLVSLVLVLLLIFTACKASVDQEPTKDPSPSDQVNESPRPNESLELETEVKGLIHVNQVGYRTEDEKIAILVGEYDSFQLVAIEDEKETVVLNSKIESSPLFDVSTGDLVYKLDFSQVTEPGQYYLSVAGAGRSYPFQIGDNIYNDLKDALLKFMYYQRCGIELKEEHAGQWHRPECHTEPGILLEDNNVTMDTVGGWHDAGDFGKYTVPAAVTLADMLNSYEMFPTAYSDNINIPESNNGIPDILDESIYALDWIIRMQDEKSGGFYHKLSTNNFPGFIMPHRDSSKQYLSPISPTATGSAVAVLAQASRILSDYDSEFAGRALAAAEKGWQWLIDNPDASGFTNPKGVSTGEYGDANSSDERAWAAVELYRTTGKDQYHDYVKKNYKGGLKVAGLGWIDNGGFGAISYLFMDQDMQDTDVYDYLKSKYLEEADRIKKYMANNVYNVAIRPTEYYWGSNMHVMNRAIFMLVAHLLEENPEYEQIALDQLHYLLGRNGLSQSYVSGFGSKQIKNPHHRPSGADNIKEPVPGMVAGGPTKDREDNVVKNSIPEDTPPGKAYIDAEGSYSTNEVTTYWNSPTLFVATYFCQE